MEQRWSRRMLHSAIRTRAWHSVRLLLLMCATVKGKAAAPSLYGHPSPSEEAAQIPVNGLKAQPSRCDYICCSNEIRTAEHACISQ